MRDLEPTAGERAFFAALSVAVPGVQDWYHEDDDDMPWMIVSFDVLTDDGRGVRATLRCDWDGTHLRGGWSPSCLNWDDGVRAPIAGVDTTGSDGLDTDASVPERAAAIAEHWFNKVLSTQ